MTTQFNPKLLAALNEGCVIVYAPLSGGFILLEADEWTRVDKEAQPTIAEFLDLREQGKLEHFDTMGQGHHVFHGRVDSYRKPAGTPPFDVE